MGRKCASQAVITAEGRCVNRTRIGAILTGAESEKRHAGCETRQAARDTLIAYCLSPMAEALVDAGGLLEVHALPLACHDAAPDLGRRLALFRHQVRVVRLFHTGGAVRTML